MPTEKNILRVLGPVLLVVGLVAGYALRGSPRTTDKDAPKTKQEGIGRVWTCSMHPEVRLPQPGQCPKCFMDLVPAEDSGGEDREMHGRTIEISSSGRALAEVETVAAERKYVDARVRLTGKVVFDETRVVYITAWVPGRIDRLYADYTGVTVEKGEHMVYLYSPELYSAQSEFIQALRTVDSLGADVAPGRADSSRKILESSRERLLAFGLTEEQVKRLENTSQAEDHVTLYAPRGGTVVEKHVAEGKYVDTGTRIYTLADLSRVWLKLQAYESDLAMLRFAQKVEFTVEAYPGRVFKGIISFISPVVDELSRTVEVRVIVDNSDGSLKPGMFARAVVHATLAAEGGVVDTGLEGKWISPMHPEIIKDKPGDCDVCGMPLVTAESLGYASGELAEPPLVIPDSALLMTGPRAVVYIKQEKNDGRVLFSGREVLPGPTAGDMRVILEGLSEGEKVVVNGAFKIDSALQLRAEQSMMNPGEDSEHEGPSKVQMRHQGMESSRDKTGASQDIAREESKENPRQTVCPVMGGAINKDIFVDYNGKRVYFCCPGCETEFMKAPEKYMKKLK